tara:strand:+ start:131 stop:436 length:306 start_codon:yes stop_codon:yes gene_type:complete
MPSDQIPCVELVALKALADLEQLEGPWHELMQSKDPESVALAFRLALAHLAQTSKHLQIAAVIQQSEQLLKQQLVDATHCFDSEEALLRHSCKQGIAQSEA